MVADGTPWQVYGLLHPSASAIVSAGVRDGADIVGAFHEEELLGWIWFERRGTFHHAGYVRILVVGSANRRSGTASRLMDHAETEILGGGASVFLLVSEWNVAARAFYAGRGYAEVGRLDGYVNQGSSELICWKRSPRALDLGAP
jgi:ribosomal protein S18 acetylase RimI-like enzyme